MNQQFEHHIQELIKIVKYLLKKYIFLFLVMSVLLIMVYGEGIIKLKTFVIIGSIFILFFILTVLYYFSRLKKFKWVMTHYLTNHGECFKILRIRSQLPNHELKEYWSKMHHVGGVKTIKKMVLNSIEAYEILEKIHIEKPLN